MTTPPFPSVGPLHPLAPTAIANLVYHYAELLDHGAFDAVGQLLKRARVGAADTPDEHLLEGAEALGALFAATTRRFADGTPGTKHVTTNLIVEAEDEDHIRARSYFTVFQAVAGVPLQPIVSGRYHDRFAQDDAGWYFIERRFFLDLIGNVSSHLLMDVPSTGA